MAKTNVQITKKELSDEFRDEFVKNLQGKDFILYGGLLLLGKANNIKGIRTEVIQTPTKDNDYMAVVKAIVVDEDGNEWHGIGDADNANCNKNIAAHKVRMAETRAKGRALRDMLGIDMVLDGELTDPYEKQMITQQQTKTIKKIMEQKDISKDELSDLAFEEFGVKTAARLQKEQAEMLISMLELWEDDDEEEDDDDE